MMCATFRTSPVSLAQFQSSIDRAALAASLRTRGKAVYLDEIHTIPPALVFKQGEECSERSIPYGLCQMVVTLHSLHVQMLHADGAHLALVRECMGDFVKVILTGVSNTLLQPGYKDASLVAIGRTFLFAAQPLLQQSQAVKVTLQVLRVVKRASVRTYCK